MVGIGFLVGLCCAVFYYRLGEMERISPALLALASIAVTLAATFVLGWGAKGILLAQAGIFAALTVRNFLREKR